MNAHDYLPGTPAYNAVLNSQGKAAADAQLQAAIDAERNQTPLNDSTWSIFGNQLATDPLGAPIESLNGQIGKVLGDLFKNPLVLGAIALGLFFFFGGADVVRGWLKGGKQ